MLVRVGRGRRARGGVRAARKVDRFPVAFSVGIHNHFWSGAPLKNGFSRDPRGCGGPPGQGARFGRPLQYGGLVLDHRPQLHNRDRPQTRGGPTIAVPSSISTLTDSGSGSPPSRSELITGHHPEPSPYGSFGVVFVSFGSAEKRPPDPHPRRMQRHPPSPWTSGDSS